MIVAFTHATGVRGLKWSRREGGGREEEGEREKERGGTREGVEGASNKKPLRPCPDLRNPFSFAIISQGSQADIELRLKCGARGEEKRPESKKVILVWWNLCHV